jgi:hypothetical protein
VALAGDDDDVAGRGERDRALDRGATVDHTLGVRRPCAISAMIASGSSLRGLSEVMIATSAWSAAPRP